MIQTRRIGEARVTRVHEYAAPTHDPAFLFPDLPQAALDRDAPRLAPHHYVPALNRLIVAIQFWVIRHSGAVIVLDAGVGNGKPRAAPRMDRLNNQILPWLEAAGAAPEQVTHVVQTHMHCDHTGWNTVRDGDQWVPTFPNATYLIPRADFEHYREATRAAPDPIIDASLEDSVLPVIEAGLAEFVEDQPAPIAGCLTPDPVPGHSPGMISYRLRSGGEAAWFTADVFHSPLQILHPDLNTGYCVDPARARATRARVLAEAAETGELILPTHFGAPHAGHVRREADAYRFAPAPWPELDLPA